MAPVPHVAFVSPGAHAHLCLAAIFSEGLLMSTWRPRDHSPFIPIRVQSGLNNIGFDLAFSLGPTIAKFDFIYLSNLILSDGSGNTLVIS